MPRFCLTNRLGDVRAAILFRSDGVLIPNFMTTPPCKFHTLGSLYIRSNDTACPFNESTASAHRLLDAYIPLCQVATADIGHKLERETMRTCWNLIGDIASDDASCANSTIWPCSKEDVLIVGLPC